jgi:hypothetical protein
MPFYMINLQLEKEKMREFIIEDARNNIDFVYDEYRRRVNEKNGAGRVIYFDLVMIAEASLKHLEGRKEVLNESNSFGFDEKLTMRKPD